MLSEIILSFGRLFGFFPGLSSYFSFGIFCGSELTPAPLFNRLLNGGSNRRSRRNEYASLIDVASSAYEKNPNNLSVLVLCRNSTMG
jgi:hypothetical protein